MTSTDTDPMLPGGVGAMGHIGTALGCISPEAAETHLFVFLTLKFHVLPFFFKYCMRNTDIYAKNN